MQLDRINYLATVSLVKQISNSISKDIEAGVLKKNQRLLSINNFSRQYEVARDTVEKAYISLKKEGYIQSVSGKGYFVLGKTDMRIKVLLLFNKLSSYKKMVYDTIVDTLGDKAKVDLHIHHYDPALLEESIEQNLNCYHYFVVMPHFFQDSDEYESLKILKKIPAHQLILLDKRFLGLDDTCAVYQDFRNDIYKALTSVADITAKYQKLTIIFPLNRNHPVDIQDGVRQFCEENNKELAIISKQENEELIPGNVYIVLTEDDLAQLIKRIRASGYIMGKEIGVISFNETVFKELLDITVITTDFEEMGKTTARLILNNDRAIINNPFKIILRNSL